MTTIERKARVSYFSREPRKSVGAAVYTFGYKDGFLTALDECRCAINSKFNNKEKLEALDELFKKYEHESEGRS